MNNIPCWLIYHTKRKCFNVNGFKIYADNLCGNQDPYIFNERFLHTFCHITQFSNVVNQINFWVTGDCYPNFENLYCDLVFVTESIHKWNDTNCIKRNELFIDNDQSFKHHYNFVNHPTNQHHFKKRSRVTLKANLNKSFQPQDKNQNLIDIIPFLVDYGFKIEDLRSKISLRKNLEKAIPSKPLQIDNEIGKQLYNFLESSAIKLKGDFLADKHPSP